jgi:hypothetical protein
MSDEDAGRLLKAIYAHVAGEDVAEADEPLTVQLLLPLITGQIDRADEKYQEVCDKRAEAGRRGAEARWQNMANDSKAIANDGKNGKAINRIAKMADPEPDSEPDIEKETPTESRKRFVPPTVEEVREYVREKGYSVDPETFVDFYASKGWVVGKSPMKDWRAAVRTWAKDRKEQTPPNRNPKIQAAYGFSTERKTVNYNEIAMQRAWQEG